MIVLADNDILIKLAGCNLLQEFLDLLKTSTNNIFITNEAKYSIPKKAKKKISDDLVRQELCNFIADLQILPMVDANLLAQIQAFDNIDGGEALLMLSMHHYPNANFITGDKRCLEALIQNKDKAPLTEIFNLLKNKVYCFESALLALIDTHGFDYVNQKIMNKSTDDGVLKLAFGQNKNETDCIECLSSYCRDVILVLAKVNLYKE